MYIKGNYNINLHLLKFPDIVKLHTCLFLYDHIHDKKSSKFSLNSFISEQHNYATRSASVYRTVTDSFILNIRKFCPSIIQRYFWNDIPPNIRTKPYKKLFKKGLLKLDFEDRLCILLFCSVALTNSFVRCLCMCVYVL